MVQRIRKKKKNIEGLIKVREGVRLIKDYLTQSTGIKRETDKHSTKIRVDILRIKINNIKRQKVNQTKNKIN